MTRVGSVLDEFEQLTAAVLDGTATAEERQRFTALSKEYPEFRTVWLEQVRLHALLTCRGGGVRTGLPFAADGRPGEKRASVFASRRTAWWKAAAALAVLLGGMAIWRSVPQIPAFRSLLADLRSPTAGLRSPVSASPVALVRQSNIMGLDLPDTLPGVLRLTAGTAVIRLASGVELTVLGPARLEMSNDMQVILAWGRLLASVPQEAKGFRVHTSDLEICDLGTVFSVSVDRPVSDVFVFKGRVRVSEASRGNGENAASDGDVWMCAAGEGVRAIIGEPPVKVAADWPAAKKVLAAVRNQVSMGNPATAFAFAEKIADLREAKNSPLVGQYVASSISARNSASRNEENEMISMTNNATVALAIALLTSPALQNASADIVSNYWAQASGTNSWNVPENWTPAGPPGSSSILDMAMIPATATGVINYDSAGPTFANLNVATTNPAALTINISAPLVLKDGAIWGGATSQTGLHTVVTSSGSITSINSTASYSMTMNGGQFDVEAGGTMMVNRDSGAWKAWNVNGTKVTLRGAVMMPGGKTFTGTSPTSLGDNTSLTMDGGSLDTDALGLGHNCNVRFTANGGRLCTQLTGSGIGMGGAGNYTYQNSLILLAGAITNDSRFLAGYANTWGGEGNTAGASYGGTATVNLSGGTFVQRGYTSVGNGRIGNMAVSGTVFQAANDFYIGGGDYLGAVLPSASVVVSGRVSLVSGSITVTNAPQTQASTGVGNQNGNSQNGAAQFYIAESTLLWTGQRIVFTNLTPEITGLSTGVTYYVKMFRWNSNAKCFNVAAYPGVLAPSLGTATGGSAQWQTFPAILSVGNTATFSTGTRLAPGVLDISGGALFTDQLVATNGTSSVVRFTKGSLNVLLASNVSNGVPFTVGNGTDAAVLGLAGTARFANGLTVNTNATLAIGGTNAVGAVAVTGNVTLAPGSILDVDFNSATNDFAEVAGAVTLPTSVTPRVRAPSGTVRSPVPVLRASGGISGIIESWPHPSVNGIDYKFTVSNSQLFLTKIPKGTVVCVF